MSDGISDTEDSWRDSNKEKSEFLGSILGREVRYGDSVRKESSTKKISKTDEERLTSALSKVYEAVDAKNSMIHEFRILAEGLGIDPERIDDEIYDNFGTCKEDEADNKLTEQERLQSASNSLEAMFGAWLSDKG